MSTKDEIGWFKNNFAADVMPSLTGTPLSFDLICAIAFQESGELWSKLRLHLPRAEVLRLSVGDTLDTPNRSAFPKNKNALVGVAKGEEMFALAHSLLVEMSEATGIEAYKHVALKPHKFVHGYGIFQYDLQFFHDDPDFFLEQRWKKIENCVEKMMGELRRAVHHLGYDTKTSLTDLQSAFVAIVYNTGFGNFNESRGLEQGHSDGVNFYGENIDRYLKIARTVPTPNLQTLVAIELLQPAVQPLASAGSSIVAIAKAEIEIYRGINEGAEPLRSHIADYYEAGGGSRNLNPTLDENAWSAAFVSYCVKQSGVPSSQFVFSLSHSVFVRAAIANADANRGTFRGHRITEYAPKPGDLVHHNRSGGTLGFDFARANSGYPSHSAIVVDFDVRGGERGVVTIGGNEHIAHGTGTVGTKFFPLNANGMLNQAAIGPKLICVVENLSTAGSTEAEMPLGPYVVTVRTDLKLRGGPGAEFPVIKSLLNGTIVNVLEFDEMPLGRWALVDLEGDGIKDGYVFAKFIVPVGP